MGCTPHPPTKPPPPRTLRTHHLERAVRAADDALAALRVLLEAEEVFPDTVLGLDRAQLRVPRTELILVLRLAPRHHLQQLDLLLHERALEAPESGEQVGREQRLQHVAGGHHDRAGLRRHHHALRLRRHGLLRVGHVVGLLLLLRVVALGRHVSLRRRRRLAVVVLHAQHGRWRRAERRRRVGGCACGPARGCGPGGGSLACTPARREHAHQAPGVRAC